MYKIIIKTRKNKKIKIKVDYANNFIKRFKGLMLNNEITPLLFKQKNHNKYMATIHTHFMKKPIDIIYVNTDNKIQEITTLKPWKTYTPHKSNIKYIIELSENTIKENNIELNNKIKVVKNHEKT